MPNSSATGGALLPTSSPGLIQGDALDDFLQAWVVSLCGIDPTMVRPRWQPAPANIPVFGTDWCAFGITLYDKETFAAELHFATGNGYNEVRLNEEVTCMVSFYGPNSASYVSLLSDNMQASQNREILSVNAMGLVSAGNITPMPELIKERWLKRFDLSFIIRRQIIRDYNVLSITSAQTLLNNEHYIETINVP